MNGSKVDVVNEQNIVALSCPKDVFTLTREEIDVRETINKISSRKLVQQFFTAVDIKDKRWKKIVAKYPPTINHT